MKLIFLFRCLVINSFILYFLPQKSIQIWLHSETLEPCPVNPARNCCFIEAIFSLNNNQTFIASFMLWAKGVSCSVALLCPSCSFQLCSLVWRKYGRKKHLFEPVFIIIYYLISWSNMTLSPYFPSLCFNSLAVKSLIMSCTLKSYDVVNTLNEHCCESQRFEIWLLFWDPAKQCENSISVWKRFTDTLAWLDVTSDGIMSCRISWEVQLGSRAREMVSHGWDRISGRACSVSLSEMTRTSCKKCEQMTSD